MGEERTGRERYVIGKQTNKGGGRGWEWVQEAGRGRQISVKFPCLETVRQMSVVFPCLETVRQISVKFPCLETVRQMSVVFPCLETVRQMSVIFSCLKTDSETDERYIYMFRDRQ